MTAALELVAVSKRFGATLAVDGLSLSVPEGAFLGLLGRNGAGKTTTIHLATGLLRPTSGEVRVLGLDPGREPLEVKRRIGVMPQQEGLLDLLTAPQVLRFVGRFYGLDAATIERRAAELFATLDLAPAPGTLVRELSFGMRKKLALAAALLHAPRLLFLDEPFEGIDPLAGRTVRDLLARLQQRGVTLVMSSHALEIVERLCDRVAILERGRLIAAGTMAEVRRGGAAGAAPATLEEVFVDLMGGARKGELSWL